MPEGEKLVAKYQLLRLAAHECGEGPRFPSCSGGALEPVQRAWQQYGNARF